MARRKRRFDISVLDTITGDLRLASLLLNPPRMERYAYRYKIVLPVLSASGEQVFAEHHLVILFDLFERRCGGSLASSGIAHPAWYGTYRPDPSATPVKDHHTIVYVFARPIDAADRFFQMFKTLLRDAGFQQEILMERSPTWLVEAASLPRHH